MLVRIVSSMIQYLYIISGSVPDKKYTERGVVCNDQQRAIESGPGS